MKNRRHKKIKKEQKRTADRKPNVAENYQRTITWFTWSGCTIWQESGILLKQSFPMPSISNATYNFKHSNTGSAHWILILTNSHFLWLNLYISCFCWLLAVDLVTYKNSSLMLQDLGYFFKNLKASANNSTLFFVHLDPIKGCKPQSYKCCHTKEKHKEGGLP